ncbi:MAG: sulfatase-like hydrolase/transferase [Pseudomonadota bacterium]
MYLAVVAAVIPNIPYLFLSLFFCPMRFFPILLYFLLAIVSFHLNFFVLLIIAILLFSFDLIFTISGIFGLSPSLIVDSLNHLPTLKLFSFSGYMVLAAILIFFAWLYIFLLAKNRDRFKTASLVPAFLAFCAVFSFDLSVNPPSKLLDAMFFPKPTEFTSATLQTGLDVPSRDARKGDVLIVMVEGLGAISNPIQQNLLWEIFKTEQIRSSFDVTTGTSSYFSSTTAAESRELCMHWGDHRDFRDKPAYDCLPAKYRAEGYETASFHAYWGGFFDRTDWYPKIGFDTLFFRESIGKEADMQDLRTCGLTFEGLCDDDVADKIEAFLEHRSGKPKFAYWLTLNTHIPIEAGAATPRLDCETGGPFKDWTVCSLTEMWMDLLYRIRDIALNPELKGLEILIVGDHHPPVWTRRGRNVFETGQVPWLHLSPVANREQDMPI